MLQLDFEKIPDNISLHGTKVSSSVGNMITTNESTVLLPSEKE